MMNDKLISLKAPGDTTNCVLSMLPHKILRLFIDILNDYEIFEAAALSYASANKIDRMWFAIDPSYDIRLTDCRWRCHRDLILVDDEWKVLIYYAADGKRFMNDLPTMAMPDEVCMRLDIQFPGTTRCIRETHVNERTLLSVLYNYVNGDLDECVFDIKDPHIDLLWITPFVKLNIGRKFASAHIMALRELKKRLR